MSEGRKRKRLVPPDCIEIFELRVVRYFDSDGMPYIAVHCSTPDEPSHTPELTDVMAALETAKLTWWDMQKRHERKG